MRRNVTIAAILLAIISMAGIIDMAAGNQARHGMLIRVLGTTRLTLSASEFSGVDSSLSLNLRSTTLDGYSHKITAELAETLFDALAYELELRRSSHLSIEPRLVSASPQDMLTNLNGRHGSVKIFGDFPGIEAASSEGKTATVVWTLTHDG